MPNEVRHLGKMIGDTDESAESRRRIADVRQTIAVCASVGRSLAALGMTKPKPV
jgi:hypothetical protein